MRAVRKKKEPIGALLKCARMRLELSADDVGLRCNVSRSRVYQWEAGSYVFPKNLPVLSEALNIPLGKLQALNGHPPHGV